MTEKPAKSGPDGSGYRITVTKECLKKAGPILVIALKLTQLALIAYEIPFPSPTLPLPIDFSFDFSFDSYLVNVMTCIEIKND